MDAFAYRLARSLPTAGAHLELVEPRSEHCLLVLPDCGAQPILEALAQARRRIRIKMFKLTSEAVIAALVSASQRGVDVRVLLNPARSDGSRANDRSYETLSSQGVTVHWTAPQFAVTHEKSIVIDDVALICTFNLADKYFTKCRGYAVVTRNRAEVQEVLDAFEADWHRTDFSPRQLIWSQGSAGNAREKFRDLFRSAQSEILIQNPKLVDAQVLDELLQAVRRGVRVCFLSSGLKGLSAWDIEENTAAVRALQSTGGSVRALKKPKMHAKLVLVDGRRAVVGSQNLDRSCFDLRRELAILVEARLVPALRATFQKDWDAAAPFPL